MNYTTQKTLLFSQSAPIITPQSSEQVMLFGTQLSSDSPYFDELELQIITSNERSYIFPLSYGGYNIQLFLGDFTGNGTSELLISSSSGGSGDYAQAYLYCLENGELEELFSSENFNVTFSYSAYYLPYYEAQVISHDAGLVFNLKLTQLSPESLDLIYNATSQVATKNEPYVSAPVGVFPLKLPQNTYYDLLIWQRIIGPTNATTLGVIQTHLRFTTTPLQLVTQSLVTSGTPITTPPVWNILPSQLLALLPKGSKPLPPPLHQDQDVLIIEDLNHDGINEILLSYSFEGVPSLAVFSYHLEHLQLLDTYQGKGHNIHDLTVISLKKDKKGILVGWQQDHLSSILNILELKGNKLIPLIQNNLPTYSFFDLIDFNNDGQMEIILWMHDTNEAYKVQVYEALQTKLLPTNTYNKIYFQKVIDYYRQLLKHEPDHATYLYYLALAQAQLGTYSDALTTLDHALTTKHPYPSVNSIKKLRNNLKAKERMH